MTRPFPLLAALLCLAAPLAAHTRLAETRTFDRDARPTGDLDTRLAELVRRGERMAAIELARREEPLSLLAAKEKVEALARRSV